MPNHGISLCKSYFSKKGCALFLLVAGTISPLYSNRAFVTCDLDGQLGNQLCIIAATLAYSWDHDVEAIFPQLNRPDLNMSYNRDHFFFRLDSSALLRPVANEYKDVKWWDYSKIPFRKDQNLKGGVYFCSKHFHHHREKLLEVFAPSQKIQDYLQDKYGWLLAHPKTVSIHVRTYNKELHFGFPFAGLDYYEKAIKVFPDDTIFVLFSDRINWCKHHFKQLKRKIIFIEGNDHIQDFFLMSQLKGHILSNSAYSWWAAYLDKNPRKVIVAPKHWYRLTIDSFLPRKNSYIFFPDWVIISNNPNAPYPEDMKRYDSISQSLDTQ